MELLRFTHKNILKQQQFGSFSQMAQSAAGSALQGGLNSVIQGGNFMTGVKGSLASMKPSTGSIVGMAADTISSFLPQKTEYDGDKGHITQSLDGIYDNVSDAIGMVPGWGTAASVIMKGAKVLGQGVNALGGGTDGMTSTDAILGSSFLNLTPMGLINGFGGSRSDNFVLNEDAFSQVGSSYEGSLNAAMNAKHKAGKKYGLFSKGEKEKANKLIAEARKQQAKISTIADSAKINNEILANQSDLANRASNFELSGGYDMTSVRAAKNGGTIDLSKIALPKQYSRAIRLAKLGAKVEKPLVFNYDSEQVTDEMLDQLLNITYLEEGGKIAVSEQPNLLPEGALHKNKHH